MAHGLLTAKVARSLSPAIQARGFDVLFGHGQIGLDSSNSLGKLKSWFGPKYQVSTILADLDIAIVARATDQLAALVEIEETTSKPKVILGDVLATLLGSQITFQGKRYLHVSERTHFIILVRSRNAAHRGRLAYLEVQANQLKTKLDTPNARLGHITITGFENEVELEQRLRQLVQASLDKLQGPNYLSR